jgi:hypothetical protein
MISRCGAAGITVATCRAARRRSGRPVRRYKPVHERQLNRHRKASIEGWAPAGIRGPGRSGLSLGAGASCPDSKTREYHYGHRQRYREPDVTFAEPRRHGEGRHSLSKGDGRPSPDAPRPAARAPRAATQPRRRAWLRIFVVRCGLPCDPPVGGHSCNGGMIPRFHRVVSD